MIKLFGKTPDSALLCPPKLTGLLLSERGSVRWGTIIFSW